MNLTEAKLKVLILEVWRGMTITLPLPQGPVDLPIPKGFSKRKGGPDKYNPGLYDIKLLSHDKQKMMEIAVNLKTGGVSIHTFVREKKSKVMTHVDSKPFPAGTYDEAILDGYFKMIEELKNEKPHWM